MIKMEPIKKKLLLEIEITPMNPVLDIELSYQDEEGEEEVVLFSKETVADLVMDTIIHYVDKQLNPYDTESQLNHEIGERIDTNLDDWALENFVDIKIDFRKAD